MTKTALILFTREPQEGKVKTRLMSDLPTPAITKLYEAFIKDVTAEAMRSHCDGRFIYFTRDGGGAAPFLEGFRGPFHVQPQAGHDLGTRMHHAFSDCLKAGFKRTVLIGADCLTLTAKDLDLAFEKLKNHDCVLGPSRDGGYYLIGLGRSDLRLFSGIAWGTSDVLAQTIQKTGELKKITFLLREDMDVDTLSDLQDLSRRIKNTSLAPYTRGVLREIGF